MRQLALFTFVASVLCTGILFAFSSGPGPGVNGVFGPTCNQGGCHTGNAVNAPGGSLLIAGLPAQWTPGQTYPLTVSMQRGGAMRYGFQLSAVVDATTQKAGTFTENDPGIALYCFVGTSQLLVNCSTPGAIQYAEHTTPSSGGNFQVNWTAPATAIGPVRFNVAVNAANGNGQSTGDFIYTREDIVAPITSTGVSSRAFSIGNLGSSTATTAGTGNLTVGHARVQPDSGKTTPSGVAIFSLRQSGVLVSEAGVPAAQSLLSGRIYAEVGGSVNTGVAIANPGSTTASVAFHFTDLQGVDFGSGTTSIPANGQIAAFLNQAPFNGGDAVQGTFSFTATVPVAVIALRGFTNERGEFLVTTQPVVDTSAIAATGATTLAHFADGGGWTTQVLLINPTDSTQSGTVQFRGKGSATAAGAAVTVIANGQAASDFGYSIPRRSSFKLTTSGPSTTSAGTVRIVSSSGSAPSSMLVFSYKPAGVTVSEAGVTGASGNAFRVYAEITSVIKTGIAIANENASASTDATLELFKADGSSAGPAVNVSIPANGQTAAFLHELFPASVALPLQGVLRVSSSSSSGISLIGLRSRYNERGDFLITTMPVVNEAAMASPADSYFPHIADGGGYTTQFVIFSGVTGQTTSGTLNFTGQNGSPLLLWD